MENDKENYKNIVVLDKVNYTTNTGKTILKDISFNIKSSDFISILGPNGAGKTTLFKLILGIEKITTGSINFNNLTRKDVAYVPQVKTLDRTFPASALELVCTGINKTWSFWNSKKDIMQATEVMSALNAEHLANRQLKNLSGGELQRIYLARAIAKKPKLLLLDEPATGVDFICEKDINEVLTRLNDEASITIVMITHDFSTAYCHSKNVLLLNKEKIYYGDPQSALTDKNLMATFSNTIHTHDVKFGIKKC